MKNILIKIKPRFIRCEIEGCEKLAEWRGDERYFNSDDAIFFCSTHFNRGNPTGGLEMLKPK